MYFILPPYLTCASALPGETGNPKIESFLLNAACLLPKTHETHYNITWLQLNSLHCQKDRLDAPDRT